MSVYEYGFLLLATECAERGARHTTNFLIRMLFFLTAEVCLTDLAWDYPGV